MKLTTDLLKKIILEELNEAEEQPASPDAAPTTTDMPTGDKSDEEGTGDVSKSTTDLGKNLIALGRSLMQSKIKNIDKAEVGLIESGIVSFLKLAEKGSAATFLKKVQVLVNQKLGTDE